MAFNQYNMFTSFAAGLIVIDPIRMIADKNDVLLGVAVESLRRRVTGDLLPARLVFSDGFMLHAYDRLCGYSNPPCLVDEVEIHETGSVQTGLLSINRN
jgi:hypothetical protein